MKLKLFSSFIAESNTENTYLYIGDDNAIDSDFPYHNMNEVSAAIKSGKKITFQQAEQMGVALKGRFRAAIREADKIFHDESKDIVIAETDDQGTIHFFKKKG